MSNKTTKGLGEFEELVLLAVCILDDTAYGVSVKQQIEEHAKRTVLLGAVHITLYRLQDKGLLESELGGRSNTRGGRRKRLFKVTKAGMQQLQTSQEVRLRMWQQIPKLNPGL